MIDPQKLLPLIKSSFPKGNDAQLLEALTKFGAKHPNLNNLEALAGFQKFIQEKTSPTIGHYARNNGMVK